MRERRGEGGVVEEEEGAELSRGGIVYGRVQRNGQIFLCLYH